MVEKNAQLYWYIAFYNREKIKKIKSYYKQQDAQPITTSKNSTAIKKYTS